MGNRQFVARRLQAVRLWQGSFAADGLVALGWCIDGQEVSGIGSMCQNGANGHRKY